MRFCLCLLACVLPSSAAVAYRDVAISPDGGSLAWVQGSSDSRAGSVHVMRQSGREDVAVGVDGATASRRDETPAWSPDSKRLVFVSNTGEKEGPQLWLVEADGTGARMLADLKGFAERPHWSPDGTRVALLYVEGAAGGGSADGCRAADGRDRQRLSQSAHRGSGCGERQTEQRLRRRTGMCTISTGRRDGKRVVATAAPGPGDNNWWIAQLYVFDAATGSGGPIYQAEAADRGAALVARRVHDRLHGRPDERRRVPWRATVYASRRPAGRPGTGRRDGRRPPVRSSGGRPSSCCSARRGRRGEPRDAESEERRDRNAVARRRGGSRGGQFPEHERCRRWQDHRDCAELVHHAAGDLGGPDRRMEAAHARQRRGEARLGPGGKRRIGERGAQGAGVADSAGGVDRRASSPWSCRCTADRRA